MKQVMNFLVNTKNGQKLSFTIQVLIILGLVIGLILSIPVFWMGSNYESTWMNSIAPYFFYGFFIYVGLFLFFGVPYFWYIGTSDMYHGDARRLLKGVAIFCSIVPGAVIYRFAADALFIPHGLHNIVGMLICGILYLWMMKIIFRKPFSVVQTFIPLT